MGRGGTSPVVFNLVISAISSGKSPPPAPLAEWVVGTIELFWTLIKIILPPAGNGATIC